MRKTFFTVILSLIFCISCTQDKQKEFRSEEIEISVKQFLIKGDLLLPLEGENFPLIIFCTGSGPTDRKQSIKYSKVLRKFIENGYAFFIDDKPGSGDSKGEFSDDSLLRERATILCKEIEILKSNKSINPLQIGLYGSSQAGFVMSIALEQTRDISFVIAWSCPAKNSIEQSAYLVKKQTLCEGGTEEEAEKVSKYYIQRAISESYKDYLEAAKFLDNHSVIKDLGWGGIISENEFTPTDKNSESFINPIDGLGKITIPALFIFGEKDTQIDPVQGALAYGESLLLSGNKNYKVVTIPGVDHNMRITKTGCLKEQKETYNKDGGAKLSSEFLELIDSWVKEIKLLK